jgi:hypothetical protein
MQFSKLGSTRQLRPAYGLSTGPRFELLELEF